MELLNHLLYYPFLNLITFFTWLIPGNNAVWGIIGTTLVVRTILLVPSKRAVQSQRKMTEIQPLLDELKAEYGDDKAGLGAAQMELYKKNDINPLSSCLPMLIQLPLLFILYHAVLNGLEGGGAHIYPWVPRADVVQTTLFGIDLLRPDRFFILPLIAAALQFVQSKMMLPAARPAVPGVQPDPAMVMQRQMIYLIPVIVLISGAQFPAGVAIYWIIGTIYSIVQQYFIQKERLRLTGLTAAEDTAQALHPERAIPTPKAVTELKKKAEVIETNTKKGVQVTVRKKK